MLSFSLCDHDLHLLSVECSFLSVVTPSVFGSVYRSLSHKCLQSTCRERSLSDVIWHGWSIMMIHSSVGLRMYFCKPRTLQLDLRAARVFRSKVNEVREGSKPWQSPGLHCASMRVSTSIHVLWSVELCLWARDTKAQHIPTNSSCTDFLEPKLQQSWMNVSGPIASLSSQMLIRFWQKHSPRIWSF